MHIHIIPNRGASPTVLLRESYRDGRTVKKRTLANLSSLPPAQVETIRAALRGEALRPVHQSCEIIQSRAHGHVAAVAQTMRRLGMASVLAATPCRERNLVLAMVAARILAPHTKLGTTRWWHTTTLADDFGVAEADEDELYKAMDWLLARQDRIQQKLAARHLSVGSLVLYDLSSSYVEGTTCPLAKRGYSRDGKRGTLQVNYGLLTTGRGCPVAVSVHEGNTSDSRTFLPEVHRLRQDFGLESMVLVGDRGMIAQKAIDELRDTEGIGWITALKSPALRALIEQEQLQLGLFDERNLFELSSPDYPGERLVACRNPELAKRRAHTREALLTAIEVKLAKIRARVDTGQLASQDAIGLRVGKIVNQYKVAKHFQLDIDNHALSFQRNHASLAAEAALDGIYIIRTSVSAAQMDAADCVRHYKSLANVERAFRSLKTVDLKVRPIHHRLADRVRAHIFLCLLAYYVEWHMREAWREVLFADEDQTAKQRRDPVAPAQRSQAALAKVSRRRLADGTPVHSLATLLADLATVVRNTCRTPNAGEKAPTFQILTTPTPHQRRALALIETIHL